MNGKFSTAVLEQNREKCLRAAIVLTLAGAVLAPVAFAKVVINTIDPLATVTGNGRHIAVTGPIACTPLETAFLRVTVT